MFFGLEHRKWEDGKEYRRYERYNQQGDAMINSWIKYLELFIILYIQHM